METDLHTVIRAKILEDVHKRFIVYQLLKALKYMHSAYVIHRDLKPSNLLLNSECLVKVADFGLARSIKPGNKESDTQPILTDYVATRWYRAPEILMGSTDYSAAVDVWSVGCIIGELYLEKAIFPGNSTINQLARVMEYSGRPSAEDLDFIQSTFATTMLETISVTEVRPWDDMFPMGVEDDTIDILSKCFTFNPHKRITINECLEHQYVKQFHDEGKDDERICEVDIKIPIDDNEKLQVKDYIEAIYRDIIHLQEENKEKIKEKKEKKKRSSKKSSKTDSSSVKDKIKSAPKSKESKKKVDK